MALRTFVERKTVPLSCVTLTNLDSITGAAASVLYRMDDDDNTEAFWFRVLASRQSVAARGRRGRPLASEYAIATAPDCRFYVLRSSASWPPGTMLWAARGTTPD